MTPAARVVTAVLWLCAVIVTPERAIAAFGAQALLVVCVAVFQRLSVIKVAKHLLVELPFVAFALALPFIGHGPHRAWLGLTVSVPGVWAAWEILAKATLGVAIATVLLASSPPAEILEGLRRMRVPAPLLAIASFMIRYIDVVGHDLQRLQIARVARGDNPRWVWQGRAVAATAGAMFVRSVERGERVHAAMLARGFDGTLTLPELATTRDRSGWAAGAVIAAAWTLTALALVLR